MLVGNQYYGLFLDFSILERKFYSFRKNSGYQRTANILNKSPKKFKNTINKLFVHN